MGHGQDKGQVRARVDGQPLVGEQRAGVAARVDHDDAAAPLVRFLQRVHRRRADAVAVGASEEDHHVGVLDVGREVRRTERLRHAGILRHVARDTMRVDVSGAQRVHEALGVVAAGRTRVLDHREGLRAVGADDGLDLLRDLGICLVPAYRLELAFVVLLERFGQAVFRPCDGGVGIAARAQRAVAVRMVRVADHRDELAVLHVRRETALRRAGVAQGVHCFDLALLDAFGNRLVPFAEPDGASARRKGGNACARRDEAAA